MVVAHRGRQVARSVATFWQLFLVGQKKRQEDWGITSITSEHSWSLSIWAFISWIFLSGWKFTLPLSTVTEYTHLSNLTYSCRSTCTETDGRNGQIYPATVNRSQLVDYTNPHPPFFLSPLLLLPPSLSLTHRSEVTWVDLSSKELCQILNVAEGSTHAHNLGVSWGDGEGGRDRRREGQKEGVCSDLQVVGKPPSLPLSTPLFPLLLPAPTPTHPNTHPPTHTNTHTHTQAIYTKVRSHNPTRRVEHLGQTCLQCSSTHTTVSYHVQLRKKTGNTWTCSPVV